METPHVAMRDKTVAEELVSRLRLGGPNAAEVGTEAADLIESLSAQVEELLSAFDALERSWRGLPVSNLDERFVAVARICKDRALLNGDQT